VFDEAHCIKYWGELFREIFLRVGELHSLVSPNIKFLAMTATISLSSREYIQELLRMHSPKVVMSPCKPNIMYALIKCESLLEAFTPILEEIQTLKSTFPRTIISCRSINDCSDIYLFLKSGLGNDFLEPVDAPNLSKYRLVEMFHKHTDPDVKMNIIQSFTIASASLRLVICTTAFE
jgi:superfamily II DNA helicase RecQ